MKRRTLLARLGASAGVGALAGCLGATDGATDTPTPPSSPTPGVSDFAVEDRGCGEGTNRADVAFGDDTVRIDGTIRGGDTCDTADLERVRFADGTLTVAVVTTRDTEGTPACAQCITDIDYAATVRLGGRDPEEVVVTHDGETVARATP